MYSKFISNHRRVLSYYRGFTAIFPFQIVLALMVCGALARPDPDPPTRCSDPDDEVGPELEFDCQKRREFPE